MYRDASSPSSPWWNCGSGSASGRHMGIEALWTLPATEGDRGDSVSPPQLTFAMNFIPLICPLLTLVVLVAAGCSNTRVETTKPLDRSPGMEKPVVGRAMVWTRSNGNKTASGEILQKTLSRLPMALPRPAVTRKTPRKCIVVTDRKPLRRAPH